MKNLFFKFLKKEKWEWSWNGGVPYYLLEVLFLEPTKEYIRMLKHLKKYSLITSNYGKKISAYIVNQEDSEEKCNLYFKKNIGCYIDNYKKLIEKTHSILLTYKENFRDNNSKKINYNELKFLERLLIENIKLYLISQPEVTFVLGNILSKEIKLLENSQEIENKMLELLQPEKTILNSKDADFNYLLKKIKNKKNKEKKEIERKIFDFYWKYRSFFMVDLNGNIKEELNILKDSIKKQKKFIKKEKEENQKENYGLSEKSKKLINYIKHLGALRLEGKNAWVSLTLLIINLLQLFSKQIKIPMEVLEKYSFREIESFLKGGKKNKNFKKRENSVFIILPNKINSYHGKDALKIGGIIKGNLEKTNSVKGNVAYHGNVKGTAFIITAQDKLTDKIEEISKIKDPILIAEQTIPSYLPLIEKSKGIITNEGGILSHAAIVSREYKIPAIIGTKIATQIFKQGDKIILDTEKEVAYKDEASQPKENSNYYITPIEMKNIEEIGGKAKNTAKLKKIQGIKIPDGLIITTKLFKEVKKNILKQIKQIKKDKTKIDEVHRAIDNYNIQKRLLENLKVFLKNKEKIIVRSSATIEDAKKQSFAGQFVSEVSDLKNVESAIKKCFKGAFSLHLMSYIKDVEKLELALLVQEYKEVDKSGVAFSINPVNNYFNEIVIESVKGGCEKLVSGKVTPETLIVKRDNKEISKSNILSKKETRKLVNQIKKIEEEFKTPVDVEWGIKGKTIWIFQARPITTL